MNLRLGQDRDFGRRGATCDLAKENPVSRRIMPEFGDGFSVEVLVGDENVHAFHRNG